VPGRVSYDRGEPWSFSRLFDSDSASWKSRLCNPQVVEALSQTHIRLAEVVSSRPGKPRLSLWYLLAGQDGSRVVDPRDHWYTLCVTSGLGKFEPAKRKNATSALSSSLPSWIEAGLQTQVAVSETDTKPTHQFWRSCKFLWGRSSVG
jgi:hypothetical protein